MLARLQQAITLTLLGSAFAWAFWWAQQGRPLVAAAGALLIALGYALVLAIEFVILSRVHGDDPTPKASLRELVAAWWGEVTHSPVIFCWRQPFVPNAVPDRPEAAGRRGVVLIHGFVCNRGFWTPWMRRLRARGVPFVAVSLEPVFGSIDHYADLVEAAVRRLELGTGQAPVLVCHSMGGLAARAWLRREQADARVHRVITIGTPHRGTHLGRHGRTLNTRQMGLDSPWLQQLTAAEPPERYRRFTCFYSNCDNIVFPPAVASLPGAVNLHLPGWAHVHMVHHPQVFNEVLASVGAASTVAPGADRGADVAAR
ncbi:esterase/lipase family protein [Caldimonas brevitalea]|uniref:Permease n=1 Tax=Caldimonas brevitalea TaxID=413882 RepID=A0A0G3BPT7_9BURK|nr:alpha/beta fold hydrolase [Caldimonas brevitalea]AKJ31444.1 permease [Caldimonas brevitalea]